MGKKDKKNKHHGQQQNERSKRLQVGLPRPTAKPAQEVPVGVVEGYRQGRTEEVNVYKSKLDAKAPEGEVVSEYEVVFPHVLSEELRGIGDERVQKFIADASAVTIIEMTEYVNYNIQGDLIHRNIEERAIVDYGAHVWTELNILAIQERSRAFGNGNQEQEPVPPFRGKEG